MVEDGPHLVLNAALRTHMTAMLNTSATDGLVAVTPAMWTEYDERLATITSANQQSGLAIFGKDLIYKIIANGLRSKAMQDLVKKEECKKTGLQKLVRLLAQMNQSGNKMENAPAKNSIPNAGRVSQIEYPQEEEVLEEEANSDINAFPNARGRGRGGQRGGRGGRGNGRGNHNKGGNQNYSQPPPPTPQAPKPGNNRSGACHFCSQEGHWMQHCPVKQQMMANMPKISNVGQQGHAGFNGFLGSGNWNSEV
jgi:hypothetical protein